MRFNKVVAVRFNGINDLLLTCLQEKEENEDIDKAGIILSCLEMFQELHKLDIFPESSVFDTFCEAIFTCEIEPSLQKEASDWITLLPQTYSTAALDCGYRNKLHITVDDCSLLNFVFANGDFANNWKAVELAEEIEKMVGYDKGKGVECVVKFLEDFRFSVAARGGVKRSLEVDDIGGKPKKAKLDPVELSEYQIEKLNKLFSGKNVVVVLDLDHTLWHAVPCEGGGYRAVLRPHLETLMAYITGLRASIPAIKWGIWTNADRTILDHAVNSIFSRVSNFTFDFNVSSSEMARNDEELRSREIKKSFSHPKFCDHLKTNCKIVLNPNQDLYIIVDDNASSIADRHCHLNVSAFYHTGLASDRELIDVCQRLNSILVGLCDHSTIDGLMRRGAEQGRVWWVPPS